MGLFIHSTFNVHVHEAQYRACDCTCVLSTYRVCSVSLLLSDCLYVGTRQLLILTAYYRLKTAAVQGLLPPS